jgi:hypothetical protein
MLAVAQLKNAAALHMKAPNVLNMHSYNAPEQTSYGYGT